MTKFKGKFRIESSRLPDWDYTSPGYYFVTICTHKLCPFFGEVVGGYMKLSPIGEIVADEWQRTATIRKIVSLDEWVMMPNHIHGIILLLEHTVETTRRVVSTNTKLKPNSLGSIIGQIKSICTKHIRAAGYPDFAWQARFYDHIIRDDLSLQTIREYIQNNPGEWELDHENPQNIDGRLNYVT
jgi:REP element-mobilizing transposase RayT